MNIAYLENATDFSSLIRERLLHEESGNATADVYVGRQRLHRTYHWQSVLGFYVLCLVSSGGNSLRNASSTASQRYNLKDAVSNYEPGYYGESMDLLYHRLDLSQGAVVSPRPVATSGK